MCIHWIIIYVTLLCCGSCGYLSSVCLAIYLAYCYLFSYKNRPFSLLRLTMFKLWHRNTKLKLSLVFRRPKKLTHTCIESTWWLHTYICSPSSIGSFLSSGISNPPLPFPPMRLENSAVPDSTTSFCSHPAHFYWCWPTFSQCLSSLLPLDLLLVAVSALSFCFAPR